jgi:superfamily II DNA or RNA helicase
LANSVSLQVGQTIVGAAFDEPMRVETVQPSGELALVVGLVGVKSERFRRVTFAPSDIETLTILDESKSFDADARLLRLGLQAHSLGIAYEFDPYFGLSISRVDPLPHQLEAIYDYLLKLARVRFLLADDAGAGKTIMAGLLIRELKLRGLAERILIVVPANLAFQWQRELKEKFDERFIVIKGRDIRDQFGVNQWLEQPRVITSLDLAKRQEILPGLRQVHWDLVIIDEAHRMSAADESHKSMRYKLGEMLRDSADHLLLLTATPHKGDPQNFSLFLQLLDADAYADVKSIRQAMERRYAPFYLRRTKEAMVYFPQRLPDGTWAAQPIFTNRITRTVGFNIDGDEDQLYRDVTRFVKQQSSKAAAQGDDPRARAVGFLMALYQRRLASSTRAMRKSLENRANRLDRKLAEAQELAGQLPDLPDPDDWDEMEDEERERQERALEAVTIARNAGEVRDEIARLRGLAVEAMTVEDSAAEAKLSKLRELLQQQGFFDDGAQRLLLFTEFRDTLDYLVERLRDWGFHVGFIHGGMAPGSRDEPGTRLYAEQQFKDGHIQILVATEAAGEGINLQVCHILFNYDIPWNPNRLEQRMGRIHRYGQKKDCLIFNFVATNTIEGSVLQTLLRKLQEIRNALDDDAVFNVVGEVLPASHVERVLREYYAGRLGDADLEERLLRNVDERHFRDICQNALEGLAAKKLNLEMLIERKAIAQERRVVPETIARFLRETSAVCGLAFKPVTALSHTFDPGPTPPALRRYEHQPDWKLAPLSARYPRLSTDRHTAEDHTLEWVTPGHPLFEAVRRHTLAAAHESFHKGATFYSVQRDAPARIDFYRARVVDGLGDVVHERLFAVETAADGTMKRSDPSALGDLLPTGVPATLPDIAHMPEPSDWAYSEFFRPFLEEVRTERTGELDHIAEHIDISLTELLQRADDEIGRADAEVKAGAQGAEGRLAMAESRHAEVLARRDRRRRELEQQRSLTLQAVERLTSVLILPHPEQKSPDLSRLRPDYEVEAIAMRVAAEYEEARGCEVFDVHEKNLGYDLTSVNPSSGELRLIEVKGIGAPTGTILLTPNERRVAEDRRDCYWLYVVSNCNADPKLDPIADPARLAWHEVSKVSHYYLSVDAATRPTVLRDERGEYRSEQTE